jgi:hypothetical protein
MWNWRAGVLLSVAAVVVSIVIYDSGWAKREASAAFAARFGKVPQLSLDHQHHRGVICGSFRFPFQKRDRFVFVSQDSAGDYPEGLNVSSDAAYRPKAQALCESPR